jgi:long-chain acyl-CoA synthetase
VYFCFLISSHLSIPCPYILYLYSQQGVELTNNNLKSVVTNGKDIFGDHLNASNRSLAFLPWAHVYGTSSELNSFIYHGSSMAIVATRDQVP